MRYSHRFVTASALILTACAGQMPIPPAVAPDPIVRTVTVDRAVPVPCLKQEDIPAEPEYPATDEALAALTPDFDGAWNGISLVKGEIAVRKADQARLRGVLQACVGGPK